MRDDTAIDPTGAGITSTGRLFFDGKWRDRLFIGRKGPDVREALIVIHRSSMHRRFRGRSGRIVNLRGFFGYEQGFEYKGERYTISILHDWQVLMMAFDSLSSLIIWETWVKNSCGFTANFYMNVARAPQTSRVRELAIQEIRLHIHEHYLALVAGRPQVVLDVIPLTDLRVIARHADSFTFGRLSIPQDFYVLRGHRLDQFYPALDHVLPHATIHHHHHHTISRIRGHPSEGSGGGGVGYSKKKGSRTHSESFTAGHRTHVDRPLFTLNKEKSKSGGCSLGEAFYEGNFGRTLSLTEYTQLVGSATCSISRNSSLRSRSHLGEGDLQEIEEVILEKEPEADEIGEEDSPPSRRYGRISRLDDPRDPHSIWSLINGLKRSDSKQSLTDGASAPLITVTEAPEEVEAGQVEYMNLPGSSEETTDPETSKPGPSNAPAQGPIYYVNLSSREEKAPPPPKIESLPPVKKRVLALLGKSKSKVSLIEQGPDDIQHRGRRVSDLSGNSGFYQKNTNSRGLHGLSKQRSMVDFTERDRKMDPAQKYENWKRAKRFFSNFGANRASMKATLPKSNSAGALFDTGYMSPPAPLSPRPQDEAPLAAANSSPHLPFLNGSALLKKNSNSVGAMSPPTGMVKVEPGTMPTFPTKGLVSGRLAKKLTTTLEGHYERYDGDANAITHQDLIELPSIRLSKKSVKGSKPMDIIQGPMTQTEAASHLMEKAVGIEVERLRERNLAMAESAKTAIPNPGNLINYCDRSVALPGHSEKEFERESREKEKEVKRQLKVLEKQQERERRQLLNALRAAKKERKDAERAHKQEKEPARDDKKRGLAAFWNHLTSPRHSAAISESTRSSTDSLSSDAKSRNTHGTSAYPETSGPSSVSSIAPSTSSTIRRGVVPSSLSPPRTDAPSFDPRQMSTLTLTVGRRYSTDSLISGASSIRTPLPGPSRIDFSTTPSHDAVSIPLSSTGGTPTTSANFDYCDLMTVGKSGSSPALDDGCEYMVVDLDSTQALRKMNNTCSLNREMSKSTTLHTKKKTQHENAHGDDVSLLSMPTKGLGRQFFRRSRALTRHKKLIASSMTNLNVP